MNSIKQSVTEMTQHFNTRMVEFQKDLQNASTPISSSISDIAAQFTEFRSFILGALESLQAQIEAISRHSDHMEMRTRRKMLLIHGVPEEKSNNLASTVSQVLSKHLGITNFSADTFSRCQRFGRPDSKKPRAILVKFRETSSRDEVWFAKSKLKGTDITISEFLTKSRHEAFLMARQHLGITKCWTRDGTIICIGPDGVRHRVTTVAELRVILSVQQASTTASGSDAGTSKDTKATVVRTKRNNRK
ncbi:unnamed protein product [Euphydryas editha]|uniref:Uncharacterized protein n=1 Tax=Euphydryas editha TaxID=104508 RepID=A0AAU9TH54_EUPED|nr:unnamed protein product [Euphydryas editha]